MFLAFVSRNKIVFERNQYSIKFSLFRRGLGKVRPTGLIRPAKHLNVARELNRTITTDNNKNINNYIQHER